MSFDHLMAPLIVIAPELGRSADGKYLELRDHYEIVLFFQGINIWHHRYIGGSAKSRLRLMLSEKKLILKYTKYILTIEIFRKDAILIR